MKRYEIWVWDIDAYRWSKTGYRFNARFDTMERAQRELIWYRARNIIAEIWVDGIEPDDNYSDGALEYPEGSGG